MDQLTSRGALMAHHGKLHRICRQWEEDRSQAGAAGSTLAAPCCQSGAGNLVPTGPAIRSAIVAPGVMVAFRTPLCPVERNSPRKVLRHVLPHTKRYAMR